MSQGKKLNKFDEGKPIFGMVSSSEELKEDMIVE
jgi:hypothetical protein